MSPFAAWENFYVIVGSSAGALTGLTFVVITLIPRRRPQNMEWGINAFTTPTIVHFGVTLFVAAALSAPWPTLGQPAIVMGACGLGGLGYGGIVMRRLLRQLNYRLVLEDWIWYILAPLTAYATLLVAAFVLPGAPTPALFAFAAAVLLLIFLGIRNAWDVVTYMAIDGIQQQDADSAKDPERHD